MYSKEMVQNSSRGSQTVRGQNHFRSLKYKCLERSPDSLMWWLPVVSGHLQFKQVPYEPYCWVLQQIIALRRLFCFASILFDQALFFFPSLLPTYLPTYLPTSYLYLLSPVPVQREGRDNKIHSCYIHSRISQSAVSSFVHFTFQFSTVSNSDILT